MDIEVKGNNSENLLNRPWTQILQIPVTETPNEFTNDIDLVDPVGFVRLFRQVDSQLFSGYLDLPSIYDPEILQILERIVKVAKKILNNPQDYCIVMSGCGTSGRIAYLCTRTFNRVLKVLGKPPCFKYLISGGDKSLIMSMELPEDDPITGMNELIEITKGKDKVLFIGITCGISSPYVLGQISYAMQHPENFITVLMGFNPVSLSRNTQIELWDKTCRQVAQELEKLAKMNNDSYFILNPTVGPEGVTGSTRMKGGSITKILLETIFSKAISELFYQNYLHLLSILKEYETAYRFTYLSVEEMASLVKLGFHSLRNNGHIYYLGPMSSGILGFIDASEMYDTYGEDYFTVRGFVEGGWSTLDVSSGDLSKEGPLFQISTKDFERDILPQLTPIDTIFFPFLIDTSSTWALPSSEHPLFKLAEQCKKKGSNTALILIGNFFLESTEKPFYFDHFFTFKLPNCCLLPNFPLLAEFSAKLIFNNITTGACIQKGRVYNNIMINLNVSNNKLYFRSISIISKLMNVSEEEARLALLKAIYETDQLTNEILNTPISHHIILATPKPFILPLAMLLCKGFTIQSAKEALKKDPIVRNIVLSNTDKKRKIDHIN